MRLLFVGESWLGSCARSLKEALARHAGVDLDEVDENAWFPRPQARWLRALNRATLPVRRRAFRRHVLDRVRAFRPDVVMTYKGGPVPAELVAGIHASGAFTVNVYPDYSPHAHGWLHRQAVGAYDLVISTKPFHPEHWNKTYGYRNRCVFVPQGYDPRLHLIEAPPKAFEFDVVMVATYRPEYGRLAIELGREIGTSGVRVAIAGNGWSGIRRDLPSTWTLPGPVHGHGYVDLLRKGKICIAPLTREVIIAGRRQPGDVDTTRTYELAAAHCFFIHRHTDYARSLYAEDEVPMYEGSADLAEKIRYFLAHDEQRFRAATAAHRRAVPSYSLDARAAQIVDVLSDQIAREVPAL